MVLQEFLVNDGKKKIPVAGCRCIKGTLRKNALYKVCRDSETIHKGTSSSQVGEGLPCPSGITGKLAKDIWDLSVNNNISAKDRYPTSN